MQVTLNHPITAYRHKRGASLKCMKFSAMTLPFKKVSVSSNTTSLDEICPASPDSQVTPVARRRKNQQTPASTLALSNDIHEWEQNNPDQINHVPVGCAAFEAIEIPRVIRAFSSIPSEST